MRSIAGVLVALSLLLAGCAAVQPTAPTPAPQSPAASTPGTSRTSAPTASTPGASGTSVPTGSTTVPAQAPISGALVIEPQAGAAPYVNAIQGAKHKIDVNSYLLTDYSVQNALIAAAQRGVVVRVIVAGDPYGDPGAPAQETGAFAHTPVVLRTAPTRFEGAYVFDHAKYLAVDPGYPGGAAILGSSNLSYSGLGGGNREYDWSTTNSVIVAALAQVFNADWNGGSAGTGPRSVLVLSPGAQPQLVSLIDSATKSIEIETEEFSYVPAIMAALEAKLQQHVSVRVVVPSTLSSYDLRQVRALAAAGAQVVEVGSPYIHAKLIIADGSAFIGSQNFSTSSLDKNREVGIMLTGAPVATLLRVFQGDYAEGRPLR